MTASTDACVLPPDRAPRRAAAHVLVVVTLLVLVAFIYWPVLGHSFVNIDDPGYLTRNPRVADGFSPGDLRWVFTEPHLANWHPVTTISHLLDVQLFGLNARWHLVENVFFHALCAALLYALLVRTTGRLGASALVAVLFAVHPTRVESVAWVSERKDVLSGVFMMLTLHAYVSYTRRPSPLRFTGVAALLTLGLMSKAMLVTLPAVLLLLDVWPLRRVRDRSDLTDSTSPPRVTWRRALGEKAILLLPVFGIVVATLLAQRAYDAIAPADQFPLSRRLTTAVVAYGYYLKMLVWPVDLALYVYPATWLGRDVALSVILLLALTFGAVVAGRQHRFVVVGWLWFVGMLVPAIGLVQVGRQPFADRYTYLPFIGLFIVIAFGLVGVLSRHRTWKPIVTVLGVLIVGALCLRSRDQVHVWRDSDTLLNHVMQVTHAPAEAFQRRGLALMEVGDLRSARAQLQEAVRRYPTSAGLVTSLAQLEVREGNRVEAERLFRRAMELNPDLSAPREGLSDLLQMRPTP